MNLPKVINAKDLELARNDAGVMKALRSILDLRTPTWMEEDISRELIWLGVSAVRSVLKTRKSWQELWARGTGKTWKPLSEFPDRMQKMADELERINSNFFLRPEVCINPTMVATGERVHAEATMKSLKELPKQLRIHAEVLSQRLAKVPKGKHGDWKLELSDLVKMITGKPHDPEVLDLLSAIAIALGKKNVWDDALKLAQARSRRLKKHSRT